ncbi:MAG: HAMP domain-containing protein [Oscillospiraceae bacterium]|nr:HAMP domain-containing protein [Oscillospiraceae bacterium]
MGRIKVMKKPVFRIKGLRRRLLLNTVGVTTALGLVCVLIVTTMFAAYYQSAMEADMRYRARTTTDFFSGYLNLSYNQYYQSCITYAQTFEDKNDLELQFINADGKIVASSYGTWAGDSPTTPDIDKAINNRSIEPYLGRNPQTGERIMAVSSPMIYSNGEVIGVLRYVTSAVIMDRQIIRITIYSLLALAFVLVVMLFSSNYYIHTILLPLRDIIEKAKKITGGSYGIQIQISQDDEIGELAEAINEMSMQINQNEKMQSEFISSLSHELRTPLTAITGWSETLLSAGDLNGDTRRGVKIIHGEAGRLTDMVLELLDFTKIQDGRMNLNMEMTDIRAEFEDTIYMYGSRLSQEGIKLVYQDDDEDIPEIPCDPKRLRQVFLNILDNAAKHGSEGKKIEASIACEEKLVVVKIRDYGPGIPEDELPLVKKKFYKGSSKARGSGIGLAVCDEIVQLHGGRLWLDNAEGGGTLVRVEIPVE